MRAVFYERCGAADEVLEVGEIPDLVAGPGEVAVDVAAADAGPRAWRRP